MYTLALISQKGGTGKTTLACALAVAGEHAGLETVLVDLDPQGSATKWGELRDRDTPVVTSAEAPRLRQVLTAAKHAGAGLAVIDTAPHAAEAALAAARAADFVLIPCRASETDLTAIGATVALARRAPKRTRRGPQRRPGAKPAHRRGPHGNRGLSNRDHPRRRAQPHRPRARLDNGPQRRRDRATRESSSGNLSPLRMVAKRST